MPGIVATGGPTISPVEVTRALKALHDQLLQVQLALQRMGGEAGRGGKAIGDFTGEFTNLSRFFSEMTRIDPTVLLTRTIRTVNDQMEKFGRQIARLGNRTDDVRVGSWAGGHFRRFDEHKTEEGTIHADLTITKRGSGGGGGGGGPGGDGGGGGGGQSVTKTKVKIDGTTNRETDSDTRGKTRFAGAKHDKITTKYKGKGLEIGEGGSHREGDAKTTVTGLNAAIQRYNFLMAEMARATALGVTSIKTLSSAVDPSVVNTFTGSVDLLKSALGEAFIPRIAEATYKIQEWYYSVKETDSETKEFYADLVLLATGAGVVTLAFGAMAKSFVAIIALLRELRALGGGALAMAGGLGLLSAPFLGGLAGVGAAFGVRQTIMANADAIAARGDAAMNQQQGAAQAVAKAMPGLNDLTPEQKLTVAEEFRRREAEVRAEYQRTLRGGVAAFPGAAGVPVPAPHGGAPGMAGEERQAKLERLEREREKLHLAREQILGDLQGAAPPLPGGGDAVENQNAVNARRALLRNMRSTSQVAYNNIEDVRDRIQVSALKDTSLVTEQEALWKKQELKWERSIELLEKIERKPGGMR